MTVQRCGDARRDRGRERLGAHAPVMSASASSSSNRESTRLPPLTARSRAASRTTARPSSCGSNRRACATSFCAGKGLSPSSRAIVGLGGAGLDHHGGPMHLAHVPGELGDDAADILAALDVGGGKTDRGRGVAPAPGVGDVPRLDVGARRSPAARRPRPRAAPRRSRRSACRSRAPGRRRPRRPARPAGGRPRAGTSTAPRRSGAPPTRTPACARGRRTGAPRRPPRPP